MRKSGATILRVRAVLPWLVGLVVAAAYDRAVYLHVAVRDAGALERLKGSDVYAFFRAAGMVWPWLVVGVVLVLADAAGRGRWWWGSLRRGVLVAAGALAAGGGAEVVKLMFRRLRPDTTDGYYVFRSLVERPLDSSGVGLPSSHAAVAFGGAFAVAFLFPRAGWVLVMVAVGCGVTRLLAGAHFLTDVYVGALVAYAACRGVWMVDGRVARRGEK